MRRQNCQKGIRRDFEGSKISRGAILLRELALTGGKSF